MIWAALLGFTNTFALEFEEIILQNQFRILRINTKAITLPLALKSYPTESKSSRQGGHFAQPPQPAEYRAETSANELTPSTNRLEVAYFIWILP